MNGDEAKILLVPALADELQAWISDGGKKPGDRVFNVPLQVTPAMKRDLRRAGIAYRDEKGRYADFHALRKSAGTMLGVAGVPLRVRQLFMRHGDIRLTMQTYDDADFAAMEEAVKALEKLDLKVTGYSQSLGVLSSFSTDVRWKNARLRILTSPSGFVRFTFYIDRQRSSMRAEQRSRPHTSSLFSSSVFGATIGASRRSVMGWEKGPPCPGGGDQRLKSR